MVRTLERFTLADALDDEMGAVTTNVHESVQALAPVAHDHDRDVTREAGEVGSRLGDEFRAARVLPRALEDALPLVFQHLFVAVPGGGERRAAGERVAE